MGENVGSLLTSSGLGGGFLNSILLGCSWISTRQGGAVGTM